MSKRKKEVEARVEVTEAYRQTLAAAANVWGGRKIERQAGLWTGMISGLIKGKQTTISAETDAAITGAIAELELGDQDCNQDCGRAENGGGQDCDQDHEAEIDELLDQVSDRGRLFGRIAAALEVIEAIGGADDGIAAAVDIIEAAIGHLYRAEGRPCR